MVQAKKFSVYFMIVLLVSIVILFIVMAYMKDNGYYGTEAYIKGFLKYLFLGTMGYGVILCAFLSHRDKKI